MWYPSAGWTTTVVVQPALGYHITNSQSRYTTPTHLKSAQYSLHNNATSSRKLLKMDVLTSETCWAVNWHNKASVIKLVYLYSNIKMMHGPVHIRLSIKFVIVASNWLFFFIIILLSFFYSFFRHNLSSYVFVRLYILAQVLYWVPPLLLNWVCVPILCNPLYVS